MRDLKEEIDKALDILFKLEGQSKRSKNFLEKGKIVYLQITLFKIPYVPRRKRRFINLCHSLYGEDPEICLFVPNRKSGVEYKKTTEEFIDFCVDHYTELLEKHKVRGIKTVMPVKQLRSEYGSYELRRKLVQRFDIFLCKNSLLYNTRFLTALGKIFRVANKEPFGIAFPKGNVDFDPDFDKNVQRALYTSSFFIQPYSDNYSIPIGTLSNSKHELKDNLKTVLDQLFSGNLIPGGFQNIRAMNIWPSQSKSIPLYMSTDLPHDLKQPRVRSRRKGVKRVTGELSTQPGKKVTVSLNGDVFVSNIDDSELRQSEIESDDESIDDGSDEGEEDLEVTSKSRAGSQVKTEGGTESGNDSESEDDEQIEEREQRLLKMKRQTEGEYFDKLKKPRKADEEDSDDEKINQNGVMKNLKEEDGNRKASRCLEEKKNSGKNKKKMNKSKRKVLVKEEKMAKIKKVKQKMERKLKPKAKS